MTTYATCPTNVGISDLEVIFNPNVDWSNNLNVFVISIIADESVG